MFMSPNHQTPKTKNQNENQTSDQAGKFKRRNQYRTHQRLETLNEEAIAIDRHPHPAKRR